ncbi:MAG TPA: CoA transferase [Streptosporangiaceae bacterium]|nr:CoA transferase [Streptosporangiaceae bacterium]
MADEPWRQPLDETWAGLDREAPGSRVWSGALTVTGDTGRLPSRLPVEDVAIACAGAALLAAAALHAGRGGPMLRTLRLDRGHVAAAFRSEAWLRVNGEPAGAGFAPLSRFWRAADGWVRTHGNYPWHRDALLRALGTPEDRVAAAIAGRGAREVEDLVTGAGGVAAAVRTEAGWWAEPAGQAVAAAPLVEGCLQRDGTWDGVFSFEGAPPRRRAAGVRPASGIRVLDLTRVIAGPVATRYLAALGADVLRLDPPQRPELPIHARDGLLGKRSALLDFGTSPGSARLHELLSGADVVVHGYRPHALDRFGLTPDALAERHPGLVVVSLSAWGSRGPWGGRRGFDSIVQAACGIAVAESPDGERPGALPCQLLDHGTGYLCAAAVLRALAAQATRGGTLFRELSLARTGHLLLSQPRGGSVTAAGTDPGAWLTTIGSAEGPVAVVRPLGRLDGLEPAWPSPLTRYGSDPAVWR